MLLCGFSNKTVNKEIEISGILIFHLIVDNSLFFTEDTSFLNPTKCSKRIKLTKIIVLADNDDPFYSDSTKENFSHFRILKTERPNINDTLKKVYYAHVKIRFPFLVRNSIKNNDYQILVNGKKVTFRILNASEPSSLIYE